MRWVRCCHRCLNLHVSYISDIWPWVACLHQTLVVVWMVQTYWHMLQECARLFKIMIRHAHGKPQHESFPLYICQNMLWSTTAVSAKPSRRLVSALHPDVTLMHLTFFNFCKAKCMWWVGFLMQSLPGWVSQWATSHDFEHDKSHWCSIQVLLRTFMDQIWIFTANTSENGNNKIEQVFMFLPRLWRQLCVSWLNGAGRTTYLCWILMYLGQLPSSSNLCWLL